MTRWMFPYIGFMSLVALSAGILNTWKRFAVPAATPVLLNLAVIGAAWWGAPLFSALGHRADLRAGRRRDARRRAAAGDADAGAARASAAAAHRRSASAALRAAWQHPGVRRVLRQMAPALLGVSVAQISLLINTQIASHVGVGAVSWLTYADRLMEFPTALLGVALGVVLLPQLSAAQAREDDAGATPACSTGACAWWCCWRCPARWRCSSSRSRWWRCCSTTARSSRSDVAQTARGADGLRRRPDGPGRRQGAGAGLLRAPGHPHAGAHRHRRAGRHAG